MWNLNPEYFQRVKEELTGRQAAIQALLAHELENLEADLEEVEARLCLRSQAFAGQRGSGHDRTRDGSGERGGARNHTGDDRRLAGREGNRPRGAFSRTDGR
jgi:hypothetical protein